jgi:hypothetical protein
MTDLEWAQDFVGCEIEGTGRRFNETVAVLVKRLRDVRKEGWNVEESLEARWSEQAAKRERTE